jgi:hypothetical protein
MCCLSLAERRVEYDHVLGVSQAIVMVSNRLHYISELYILEIFDNDMLRERIAINSRRLPSSTRRFALEWSSAGGKNHCYIVRSKHLDIVFKPVCYEDMVSY